MTTYPKSPIATLESAYDTHLKLRSFYSSEDDAGMEREFLICSSYGVGEEDDCHCSVFFVYSPLLSVITPRLRTDCRVRANRPNSGTSLYRSKSNKPR
jgi:hypothetical protein